VGSSKRNIGHARKEKLSEVPGKYLQGEIIG
jgi:hypothetical protein